MSVIATEPLHRLRRPWVPGTDYEIDFGAADLVDFPIRKEELTCENCHQPVRSATDPMHDRCREILLCWEERRMASVMQHDPVVITWARALAVRLVTPVSRPGEDPFALLWRHLA